MTSPAGLTNVVVAKQGWGSGKHFSASTPPGSPRWRSTRRTSPRSSIVRSHIGSRVPIATTRARPAQNESRPPIRLRHNVGCAKASGGFSRSCRRSASRLEVPRSVRSAGAMASRPSPAGSGAGGTQAASTWLPSRRPAAASSVSRIQAASVSPAPLATRCQLDHWVSEQAKDRCRPIRGRPRRRLAGWRSPLSLVAFMVLCCGVCVLSEPLPTPRRARCTVSGVLSISHPRRINQRRSVFIAGHNVDTNAVISGGWIFVTYSGSRGDSSHSDFAFRFRRAFDGSAAGKPGAISTRRNRNGSP